MICRVLASYETYTEFDSLFPLENFNNQSLTDKDLKKSYKAMIKIK